MNIAIRVDASTKIGTGHFIRCLTLADALRQSGAQIRFVSRHMPKHLRDILNTKGYEFALLNSIPSGVITDELSHTHWLGVNQAQDATDTKHALSDQTWDWLIVDHYALDASWESVLRQAAKHIIVIDDIADRQHDCDVLLDQNFYDDMDGRYAGKVPKHCQLLLGPRYALLREEFRRMREHVKPRVGPVKRILVFFGGVDPDNYTSCAIDALANIGNGDLHVDVVIGAQHPHREKIETICADHDFICHVQTSRMAELMAVADLSIGAGGSTTWERCCLGLPTLAICTADNQQKQVADAARKGLLYSPDIKGSLNQIIQRHAKALIENSYLRQFISEKSMPAVDGRGVLRVIRGLGYSGAGEMCDAVVDVRLAVVDDAVLVWPWRNDEATRRYFFDSAPVSLESHLAWWKESLADLQRVLLLGRLGGREFGVIRYDFVDSRQTRVSIYLDPDMTGLGLGESLLRAGQDWLLRNHPEVDTVLAEVMSRNTASLRTFFAAGFKEQHKALVWKGC